MYKYTKMSHTSKVVAGRSKAMAAAGEGKPGAKGGIKAQGNKPSTRPNYLFLSGREGQNTTGRNVCNKIGPNNVAVQYTAT